MAVTESQSLTVSISLLPQTIERMREMSRFSCDVQALIGGECQSPLAPCRIFGILLTHSPITLTVTRASRGLGLSRSR